jgi:Tol biopolymer transport system component
VTSSVGARPAAAGDLRVAPAAVSGLASSGATPVSGSSFDARTIASTNGRIAFARAPVNGLPNALWSMAPSGSDQQQLTPGGSGFGDVEPSYSPGGTTIAFARDQTDDTDAMFGDIFVMQADGTGIKRLTATSTGDSYPDWTPDGSRIVFYSLRTGNGDIYSMKLDGSDLRRLTTNAAVDSYPSVSPNGKRIAFASDRSGGAFDIYTMNLDGSGVTRLTTAPGHDFEPDWSPDGAKIVFSSATGSEGDYEILSMNANGSGQTNLTKDPSHRDFEPSWSPDGSKIAFRSDSDQFETNIYVMASTGGTRTPVGATADDESGPDWQPVPAFPLVDAGFSTFKADIEWAFDEGITVGCSAERYCPGDAVTRGQMATFLVRALDLPATATDYFSDDDGTTHEQDINRVRAAGITAGCAPGRYCPEDVVTRGAMASFLARAFDLPTTATDYFSDDTGRTHEADINRVAAAGITTGCTPTTYCPAADVTRGQTAAFLHRALE